MLAQKRWIKANLDRQLSKKQNGFLVDLSKKVWKDQLQVMVYIQQNKIIFVIKKRRDLHLLSSFDMVVLELKIWQR